MERVTALTQLPPAGFLAVLCLFLESEAWPFCRGECRSGPCVVTVWQGKLRRDGFDLCESRDAD